MRLFVLGATGRTGVELLDLALADGHEVTAFVRSPGKIARADSALHVSRRDLRSAEQMAPVLTGHDAVLSALGPAPIDAMTRTTLLRDCAASTLAAMERAGVKRLVAVSSAVLLPGGGGPAAFIRWLLRSHVDDMAAMEERIRASEVAWTIARPRVWSAAANSAIAPGTAPSRPVGSWPRGSLAERSRGSCSTA